MTADLPPPDTTHLVGDDQHRGRGRQPTKKARSQGRAQGRAQRLSYDDWVDGALALLAREGITAIRIPRLCAELGVTKGSFYWHFDDIEKLREAMADRWSTVQSETVRALGALDSIPVGQRIENMAAVLVDTKTWAVEATVREWARTDPKVAAAVASLEQRIFEIMNQTMLDLGFDKDQARIRAGAMVYLGIGLIHGRETLPTPTSGEAKAVINILTRP